MKKRLLALMLLVLAAAMAASCAKNGPLAPAAKSQNGSIMVKMDVLDNVASGTIEITQGPLFFSSPMTMIPVMHGVGTASFSDLQTGTWTVTAKLYDSSDTLRYYATGTAIVSMYQTTTIGLLISAGGKLEIITAIQGNDIIFTSGREGYDKLYKMDGSGTVSLIPNTTYFYDGASNPRCGGIYYFGKYNATGSLNSLTKDGSWNHVLLDNSHGEQWGGIRPSWDGSKIAFWHTGSTTNTAYCIGVGNISGGNLTSYSYIPRASTSHSCCHPVWTPDGRIVYGDFFNGVYQIRIMNSDGTNDTQIPNTTGTLVRPTDCSSSNQILYMSYSGGPTADIYRINIDGTNNTNLTSNSGVRSWRARFRNDDLMIIYDKETENGIRLFTMYNDATGSSKTMIDTGCPDGLDDQYPCFMY